MKVAHVIHKIRSFRKERCTPKNRLIGVGIILILLIVGIGFWSDWNFFVPISKNSAKAKVEAFIVSSNLAGGRKAEVKEISGAGKGLYKIMVQLEGAPSLIESYVTSDGKIFFPSAMKMEKEDITKNIPKAEKPTVELFVMSYCPFGTQIEKGIIPVLETLGNSIDFKLKFVDYLLHGKKELDENTRQYCVQQEYPDALIGYLKCFDGENGNSCFAKNGIDASKINSCVSKTNSQFGLIDIYNKESKERGGNSTYPVHAGENKAYGVKGSPALVINGVTVESRRDSASLLETICGGFEDKPSMCETKLSDVEPGVGFGETKPVSSAGGTTAGCAQ